MASETNSQNRPRVSQRQPTTHEPADGKPSRRAWVAFSIRKSSALARLIAHHRGSPQPPLCATRSLTPGVRIASGTAAKYSSRAALWRCIECPGASLACSTPVRDKLARGSGRRGRRFKSCHPDQCHRSLTCANAALRWPAFHSSPPADAPKEQKGNTREPQGKPGPTSTGRRTPGLPARHSRPLGRAGTLRAL